MSAERMTQNEMTAEMVRRFGSDPKRWAFVCPSCGDVASVQDFIDAGAKTGRVGQECIGRSLGALKREQPKGGYKDRGCDWCAYGLFRGPMFVVMPDGREVASFRIAPAIDAEVSA